MQLWQDETKDSSKLFHKGDIMPRASTLILILAAIALYALGMSAAIPAAVVLAMALEFAAWKRAAGRLKAARVARTVRPQPRRR